MHESESPRTAREWYAHSFDALYPIIYAHRSVEAAAREASFAARELGLGREDSVLDLGCGAGRHMVHLQGRVASLTGLDYSQALLNEARRHVTLPASLARADMRALPFAEHAFDAVVNFFTSFGYFEDDSENQGVVRGIAAVLRPGGRFFVDYFNAEYAVRTLDRRSTRTVGGYELRERRWVDEHAQRLNKVTEVYAAESHEDTYYESLRLYSPRAFTELFGQAGLEITRFYGDYDGGPMEPDRDRMIAVGRKR
ncbi:MAG: class I SAM-dependent methyltransferase [Candidatus Hydrogenedentota bacterium]